MNKITQEERDELLDLCEISKSVDSDYDKVIEIEEAMQSLPSYIKNDIELPNLNHMRDNTTEKLNDIDNYIEELSEDKPDWYVRLINELNELERIVGDNDYTELITHSILKAKAQYWKDFIKK